MSRRGLGPLRPDGRWSRILEALAAGPLPQGAILKATNPGKYSRKIESLKIYTALRDMRAAGLIEHVGARGWLRTPTGEAALQHAQYQVAQARRAGAAEGYAEARGALR